MTYVSDRNDLRPPLASGSALRRHRLAASAAPCGLRASQCQAARIPGGAGGPSRRIQRFGSVLNTNVHFHTLVAQGVFIEDAEGTRRFVPSPAPTDREVTRLLASVPRRIVRLMVRHGIDLEDPSAEAQALDERVFDCPMCAEIQGGAARARRALVG